MPRYMMEITDLPEDELLDILDLIEAFNPRLLMKTYWGESGGEQCGWSLVEAADPSRAREMLPLSLRDRVRIFEVQKFTADQVRRLHEEAV